MITYFPAMDYFASELQDVPRASNLTQRVMRIQKFIALLVHLRLRFPSLTPLFDLISPFLFGIFFYNDINTVMIIAIMAIQMLLTMLLTIKKKSKKSRKGLNT